MKTSPVDPLSQHGCVSVETLAKVGLTQQVDHGVVDGGRFGKHSRNGERIRRNLCGVSESSPHGHDSVWSPGTQEADTHSYRQLQRRNIPTWTHSTKTGQAEDLVSVITYESNKLLTSDENKPEYN